MNGEEREQTLEAVNRALRDLGRSLADGEIGRGEYCRLRRALVAEATGNAEPPEEEPPTGRHSVMSADSRLWSRWLPLALIAALLLTVLVAWLA